LADFAMKKYTTEVSLLGCMTNWNGYTRRSNRKRIWPVWRARGG
jgi:hypothetical protein